jgi:hypothetical protein
MGCYKGSRAHGHTGTRAHGLTGTRPVGSGMLTPNYQVGAIRPGIRRQRDIGQHKAATDGGQRLFVIRETGAIMRLTMAIKAIKIIGVAVAVHAVVDGAGGRRGQQSTKSRGRVRVDDEP